MAKGFAGIPRRVIESDDYKSLSGSSVKLLVELCYQYRGKNNGDLTIAESLLLKRGFNSKTTIRKAAKELLEKNIIALTRQGRFINPGGVCSLYALTWESIDHCKGKLDVSSTKTPPRKFSLEKFTPQVRN